MKFSKPFGAPTDVSNPLLQGVYKVPAHAPSNQQEQTKKKKPVTWIEGIKVDRVELNFRPDSYLGTELLDDVLHNAFQFSCGDSLGLLEGADYHSYKSKVYTMGCLVKVHGKQVASVMFVPKFPKAAPCKLTFNQAELQRLGAVADFNNFLGKVFYMGFDNADLACWCKLIEFAVDIPFKQSDLCWIGLARGKKTEYEGTFYLGKRGAKSVITAYDKEHELKAVQGIGITQAAMGRVEARIQSKARYSQLEAVLTKAPNPFLKIRPITKADLAVEFPPQSNLMLWMGIEQKGLAKTLSAMAPKFKAKVLKRIMDLPVPDWWQPEKFWQDSLGLV